MERVGRGELSRVATLFFGADVRPIDITGAPRTCYLLVTQVIRAQIGPMGALIQFPKRGRKVARAQWILEAQQSVSDDARYRAFVALFATGSSLLVVSLLNHLS